MSLDVYLSERKMVPFLCECGDEHHHEDETGLFSANITHNLVPMAQEAGIYHALWRPEDIGIKKAGQLIEPLRAGIALMKSDPGRFEGFNPDNNWGSYKGFVPWIENYLRACEKHPEADVNVSR